MKRISSIFLILSFSVLCGPVRAEAHELGIGAIFGEPPAGLSLKLWPWRTMALDAAFSWSSDGGSTSFRMHSDLLFHSGLGFPPDAGSLSFYYGLGVRYFQRDDRFGLRIPLGLSCYFFGAPLEVFVEFVPTLDLTPNTEFHPKMAAGIRIYLF